MTKHMFFTFLLFAALENQAQSLPGPGFGEGIVTIRQYFFFQTESLQDDPESLAQLKNAYRFDYYIKGDKILRNDLPEGDSSTSTTVNPLNDNASVSTTLTAQMVHPSYLIDWNERMTYFFFKKNGEQQIGQRLLKKDSTEIFYRLADSNNVSIKSLDKEHPVLISDRKCFKGVAVMNGEDIQFYYSPDKLKVHSPLNGFVPKDFPYEVLRVRAETNGTSHGKPVKGEIIFQVARIKECQLAADLFQLPKNAIIIKNFSMIDIIFPE